MHESLKQRGRRRKQYVIKGKTFIFSLKYSYYREVYFTLAWKSAVLSVKQRKLKAGSKTDDCRECKLRMRLRFSPDFSSFHLFMQGKFVWFWNVNFLLQYQGKIRIEIGMNSVSRQHVVYILLAIFHCQWQANSLRSFLFAIIWEWFGKIL